MTYESSTGLGSGDEQGVRASDGLASSNDVEANAAQVGKAIENRKRERKDKAEKAALADNFKEEFGFDVIITPDRAGRVIFGNGKFTLELNMPEQEEAEAQDATAAPTHPFQLYQVTVAEVKKVRVRYGDVNSYVPPGVQGGSSPIDITPVDGLLIWVRADVDEDGNVVSTALGSGSTLPDDDDTTGYRLIGQMAVDEGGNITLYQSVTHSLGHQMCGGSTHNFWGV